MVYIDRHETDEALAGTSEASHHKRIVDILARYPRLGMVQLFRQPFPSWAGIDKDVVGPQDIPLESSAEVSLEEEGMHLTMHRRNGHVVITASHANGQRVEEIYIPSEHACIGDTIHRVKDKLRALMCEGS